MTLKCWISTSAIGPIPAPPVPAAAADASAMSNGNSTHTLMSLVSNGARSAGSSNLSELRRRSVGFIDIPENAVSAASPLVTTPSRNPNVHRPSRMRSLSSTWESADFDEDEDEEKGSGTLPDMNRHDLMFASIANSSSSNNNNNNNQHDSAASNGSHTPGRRRGHHSRSSRNRRRRTLSETNGSATTTTRRVRILTPVSNKVCFGGWVRGQPAEVQWEVVDKSVQSVRIDVCNVAWSVPTTIANRVPNDGSFQWKRVYWGMPIADGYYVNIYDVTDVSPEQLPSPDQQQSRPPDQPSSSTANGTETHTQDGSTAVKPDKVELVLLARSDCFSVVG